MTILYKVPKTYIMPSFLFIVFVCFLKHIQQQFMVDKPHLWLQSSCSLHYSSLTGIPMQSNGKMNNIILLVIKQWVAFQKLFLRPCMCLFLSAKIKHLPQAKKNNISKLFRKLTTSLALAHGRQTFYLSIQTTGVWLWKHLWRVTGVLVTWRLMDLQHNCNVSDKTTSCPDLLFCVIRKKKRGVRLYWHPVSISTISSQNALNKDDKT